MRFPKPLQDKLQRRHEESSFRTLSDAGHAIDFSSNDYLGFAASGQIFDATHQMLTHRGIKSNGATGSRLISGNHNLYPEAEQLISDFHESGSALIFNSGYDANIGLFSSVPQKGDFILYDQLCHASIRDGIRLSSATAYKFAHNDIEDLERLILRCGTAATIYIATESVFSMDGDTADLENLVALADRNGCHLIVDEAHALGVFGPGGCGLVQHLGWHERVFARVVTFGKALGCHGAAVLGSAELNSYLVNFARSFIYTTGLSPHSVANIVVAYSKLRTDATSIEQLRDNIIHFNQHKNMLGLKQVFVYSKSAIQCAIVPGNEKVKMIAAQLQQKGFDVKPILSPTVALGQERLRICLHSYNTGQQITAVLEQLSKLLLKT